MLNFLKFLWQLPQCLIGFFMSLGYKEGRQELDGGVHVIFRPCLKCAVSLGQYLIFDKEVYLPNVEGDTFKRELKHEFGHHIQSMRFGWLYLLIVGLPSAIRNRWEVIAHKSWPRDKCNLWYYSHWPENNADKLGGVEDRFK